MQEMLQKLDDHSTSAAQYYMAVQEAIKAELEQRESKKSQQLTRLAKSAVKRLCIIYAPELKFSKDALEFLEQMIQLETCHVFKKLSILSRQRSAKTIKIKDLRALAEMAAYD